MTDQLKDRIKNAGLLDKVCDVETAAAFIRPNMTLGVSGFTMSGDIKKIPAALAKRAEAGEKLNLTVYSGASLGDEFDGVLARAGALKCRMPYQTNKDLRNCINQGKVKYLDMPLSLLPKWVKSGYLNKVDVAVIEAPKSTKTEISFLQHL